MAKIRDPGKRLPTEANGYLTQLGSGMLIAEDCGVAIHTKSVQRLVQYVREKPSETISFVPEIPVSTELGLTRYHPLLYWIPKTRERVIDRVKLAALHMPFASNLRSMLLPSGSTQIVETSKDEQVHYFADHFHEVCPTPTQVSVVLGNVCNLKCIMCPYHSPEITPTHRTDFFRHPNLMAYEIMDRIASECGQLRVPVKVGNVEEPLLHPRIVDFVSACRSRGAPSFHITTNGLLLTADKGRALLEAGLTSLYISLDAARRETYSRVRGTDLERVERNAHDFLRLRREMRSRCRVLMSFVRNKGTSCEEAMEFRERWLPQTDGVIFYNLAETDKGNSRFREVMDVANETMDKAKGRWPCLNPFQEIYLLPDGRVYYCCETVSKLAFEHLESMGRYPEQSIPEIWRGEPFRILRRDLILNELKRWPACENCGIWMAHVTKTQEIDGKRITCNMITEIVEKTR